MAITSVITDLTSRHNVSYILMPSVTQITQPVQISLESAA